MTRWILIDTVEDGASDRVCAATMRYLIEITNSLDEEYLNLSIVPVNAEKRVLGVLSECGHAQKNLKT